MSGSTLTGGNLISSSNLTSVTGGIITDAPSQNFLFSFAFMTAVPASEIVTVNGLTTGIPVTVSAGQYLATNVQFTVPLPQPGSYAVAAGGTLPGAATPTLVVRQNVMAIAPAIGGANALAMSSGELGALFSQNYTLRLTVPTTTLNLLDGTFDIGGTAPLAGIQRLYLGLLSHGGDSASIGQYAAELNAGVPETAIAAGFLASPEYLAHPAAADDNSFVQSLYRGFLGRPADPGAVGFQQQLAAGVSRAQVVVEIANSAEATQHLSSAIGTIWVPDANGAAAEGVYRAALGRDVDLPTDTAIRSALGAGVPLAAIVANVVGSAEYQADHAGQSDVALVASFYQNGLGRAPDPSGGAGFTAMLDAGAPVAGVIQAIATSNEAHLHLTQDLGQPGLPLQTV